MKFLKNVSKVGLPIAILSAMGPSALATAGAVETAITTAVGDAKTAGEAILAVAATVVAAFLIFKLGKRAANRA